MRTREAVAAVELCNRAAELQADAEELMWLAFEQSAGAELGADVSGFELADRLYRFAGEMHQGVHVLLRWAVDTGAIFEDGVPRR